MTKINGYDADNLGIDPQATPEEIELKKYSKLRRRPLPKMDSLTHFRFCNKIVNMFFKGNFKQKPSPKSVTNFAITQPNNSQIITYLSDVRVQKAWN